MKSAFTETEVKQEQDSETEVKQEQDSETEVKQEQDSEAEVKQEQDSETEVKQEQDSEAEVKQEQDSETEVKQEQDSETEVKQEYDSEAMAEDEQATHVSFSLPRKLAKCVMSNFDVHQERVEEGDEVVVEDEVGGETEEEAKEGKDNTMDTTAGKYRVVGFN